MTALVAVIHVVPLQPDLSRAGRTNHPTPVRGEDRAHLPRARPVLDSVPFGWLFMM
jgi:hypothetical protein